MNTQAHKMQKGEASKEGPRNINELLDGLEAAAKQNSEVNLERIMENIGSRSFAPFLLLAGLVTLSPGLGDIPGVPSIMGILILFIASQQLMDRDHIWLPSWLLKRQVKSHYLLKASQWMRKPARWIDSHIAPRFTFLTGRHGDYIIAVSCIALALALFPMEFVPFSANVAGIALTAFGLAALANDGLLAAFALVVTVAAFGLLGSLLF